MAYVASITIYPLKAFAGQSVESARLAPAGALEGDRRFALVDDEGRYVNGKRTALVHGIHTEVDVARRTLAAAHAGERVTFALDEDRGALERWFGARLERRVRLVENDTHGLPDDTEAPGPTVVSTATLETVATWFPGLTLDSVRRRFRANIEIGGVAPFWEDRLFAAAGELVPFRLGEAQLLGVNPCARCIVPTRDPATGEAIAGFAKTFARRREETLPAWANRARFDHFYRLTINTCSNDHSMPTLHVGAAVELAQA